MNWRIDCPHESCGYSEVKVLLSFWFELDLVLFHRCSPHRFWVLCCLPQETLWTILFSPLSLVYSSLMKVWSRSSDWASSGKRRSRGCLYADILTTQCISSLIKFFSHPSYPLIEKSPRFINWLAVDYLRYRFIGKFVQFASLSRPQRNTLEWLDLPVTDLHTW